MDGTDQGYDCRSYPLPHNLIKLLQFPQNPGGASDPTDPTDSPGTPDEAINRLVINYSSDYKALIYGMRLIIKAVRPVVLVPGFGGDANGYCWGKGSHSDCDDGDLGPDDTFYQDLASLGLILKKPCNYKWTPQSVFPYLTTTVFDYETGKDGVASLTPHKRCFEAVSRVPLDLLGWTGTLERNARALRWTIYEIKTRYGVAKVNLVGHSKGGLFSREYTSSPQCQGDIDNLISISSPHRGLYLMDVATGNKDLPHCSEAWYVDWLCELGRGTWEAMARIVLEAGNYHPGGESGREIREIEINDGPNSWNSRRQPVPGAGVSYHSIVATADRDPYDSPGELDVDNRGTMMGLKDPPGFGLFPGGFSATYLFQYVTDASPNRGQSDIGILAPSQRMGNIDGYQPSERSCQVVQLNHEESSRKQEAAIAVANVLGLNDDFSMGNHCGNVTEPVPSPLRTSSSEMIAAKALDTPSQSLHFTGEITYAVSTDVPFPVDGSHLSAAGLWVGDGSLELELRDPVGTAFTSTVTGTVGLGLAQSSVITEPIIGNWIARITAPASGPAPNNIQWDIWLSQRSPISFTVSTPMDSYAVGSSVTVRGYPVTGTVPILGASIEAEVRGQTGITQTISLLDDGLHNDLAANDGVYGAQLTPGQAGWYDVSASVSGTLPSDVPYLRQDRTEFRVLPISASFSDFYSDGGIDGDGDGFFEKLRIQVGVDLIQGGEYELVGSLSSPDGTQLGTVTTAISDTAGPNVTANLDFDASLLVNRSSDGPVVLSKLALIDKSIDLRTDYREDAYTTQSYSRLDFSGWEARVAGTLSDQGVDTNANGKFDYLEVQVPLEVRRAGTYTTTALLELADGSRIMSPEVVSDTLAGANVFSFQFNGPNIALHATDGPYTVTNMLVEGPLGIALFQDTVGETAHYSYLDFELDTLDPVSLMTPLSPFTTTLTIELSWDATDPSPSAGIAGYDVQYRVGPGGTWMDWLTGTVLTAYTFGSYDPVPVEMGQSYYFRVRAYDFAGNQEPYPGGDGDTYTCVTIFGDLDCNCIVDVADIMEVASRWRMTDDDPDWDPRYDLNGDGIITVVDIMLVVAHWGETCE